MATLMSFNVIKYKFRTVGKISDVRHYTVNTSFGDFSIPWPVTDQVIDQGVDFIITLRLANVFVKLTGFSM